jgi:hypothetical protein
MEKYDNNGKIMGIFENWEIIGTLGKLMGNYGNDGDTGKIMGTTEKLRE